MGLGNGFEGDRKMVMVWLEVITGVVLVVLFYSVLSEWGRWGVRIITFRVRVGRDAGFIKRRKGEKGVGLGTLLGFGRYMGLGGLVLAFSVLSLQGIRLDKS